MGENTRPPEKNNARHTAATAGASEEHDLLGGDFTPSRSAAAAASPAAPTPPAQPEMDIFNQAPAPRPAARPSPQPVGDLFDMGPAPAAAPAAASAGFGAGGGLLDMFGGSGGDGIKRECGCGLTPLFVAQAACERGKPLVAPFLLRRVTDVHRAIVSAVDEEDVEVEGEPEERRRLRIARIAQKKAAMEKALREQQASARAETLRAGPRSRGEGSLWGQHAVVLGAGLDGVGPLCGRSIWVRLP